MEEKGIRKGFVLVASLVITLVVGLVTVGLVGLTFQEYRLSVRSAAYSKALHAAESGTDLACEEFVRQIAAGGSLSGFSTNGVLTNVSGSAISSYTASATPSGADLYVITSTGRVSLAGATIQRAVKVTVQRMKSTPFKYGALAGAPLAIGGSALFDSFDSTDPAKSTNGQYDPAKAGANATLATLSSAVAGKKTSAAFAGSGKALVKGNVATAPGGEITLEGDAEITGTQTHDACQAISDVVVPFSLAPTGTINVGPWPNQAQTMTVSGSQDMSVQSLSVTAGGILTIMGSGTLRIYVNGETTVSGAGQIRITPSPSTANLKVEIYANDDVSISGSGVLNNTCRAANCAIWGTTNCTQVSMTGNAAYIGTIYAPHASVNLTGSSSATGVFLGAAVTFGGNTPYHIDESLIGSSSSSSNSVKPYKLLEWVEI